MHAPGEQPLRRTADIFPLSEKNSDPATDDLAGELKQFRLCTTDCGKNGKVAQFDD